MRVHVLSALAAPAPAWGVVARVAAPGGGDLRLHTGDVVAVWTLHLQDRAGGDGAPIPRRALMAVVLRAEAGQPAKLRLLHRPRPGVPVAEAGVDTDLPATAGANSGRGGGGVGDGAADAGGALSAADEAVVRPRGGEEVWVLLRLGGIVTVQREYMAVARLRGAPLLPALLRPRPEGAPATSADASHARRYAVRVAKATGLNASQGGAVADIAAAGGLSVLQGPPGTGKTRTTLALLNVLHSARYQVYYDSLLKALETHNRKLRVEADAAEARRRAAEAAAKAARAEALTGAGVSTAAGGRKRSSWHPGGGGAGVKAEVAEGTPASATSDGLPAVGTMATAAFDSGGEDAYGSIALADDEDDSGYDSEMAPWHPALDAVEDPAGGALSAGGAPTPAAGWRHATARLDADIDVTPADQPRRPRLLVCAPSNAGVDELLSRLAATGFVDGHGDTYRPELARLGSSPKMTATARLLTARGQAEAFVERLSAPPPGPGERTPGYKEHAAAREAWCAAWQAASEAVVREIDGLQRTKANFTKLIALHERVERLQRERRRFDIVTGQGSQGTKIRALERTFIEDAQLVFATLSGASSLLPSPQRRRRRPQRVSRRGGAEGGGGASLADDDEEGDFGEESHNDERDLFDLVVIDEAAQATEPASVIPLCLGASRLILVGDPQQLPATVISGSIPLGLSLLDRLVRSGVPVSRLDTQYRMHPAISAFPCRHFYGGRLGDDPELAVSRDRPWHHVPVIAPRLGPYVFLDVRGGVERRDADASSVFNPAEAQLAATIFVRLRELHPRHSLFRSRTMPGGGHGGGVVAAVARKAPMARRRPWMPAAALGWSLRTRSSSTPSGPRLAVPAWPPPL